MANTFVTLQTIARQALPRLVENLVFPNLCYKDFSEAYQYLGDTTRNRRRLSPATEVRSPTREPRPRSRALPSPAAATLP